MTTAKDGTPYGGITSREYQLKMPYEIEALCLGLGCPMTKTCARSCKPRTKKHFTIVPYDKRAKGCKYYVKKEKRTDDNEENTQ
jgi:hypothetical protein